MDLERLSYSLLNDKEQTAYKLLEDAVLNHRRDCDVSRIGWKTDIMHVLTSVLSDHPEIIYFNRTLLRTNASLFSKRVTFTGTISTRIENEREKRLAEKLNDAVFEIDKNARTDREIIQGISEYLQRTVTYDLKELSSMSYWRGSKSPDSHNAYGALVNNLAVCDGFASAFSLIANEFGFRNMLVEGKSNYNNTRNVDHAWNIVEFEGAFYHLDVTWDQSGFTMFNEYPYFYFGLTDDEIAIDHEWDFRTTPTCNEDKLSYYIHNKLVAYSEDQIDAIALRELRLGKQCIRIKIATNIPVPNDGGEYIGNKVLNQEMKLGLPNRINFTWNESSRCFIAVLV